MALRFEIFSHSRKQIEKTKNGHATDKPHAGANRECKIPHTTADVRAILMDPFIKRLITHRIGHMRSVSVQGLMINTPKTVKSTGPSRDGVWSGIVKVTIDEITRLGIKEINVAFQR
jgi:hypothetical protein